MMNILMQAEAASETGGGLPISVTAVYVIGFIAAIILGSIAWYNSKRPAGWEEKERPNWVPNVKEQQQDESENQQK